MRLSTRRDFLIATAVAPVLGAALPDKTRVRVVSVPAAGIQPQAALTDEILHLVYFAGDPKHGNLFYTRFDAAGHRLPATRDLACLYGAFRPSSPVLTTASR